MEQEKSILDNPKYDSQEVRTIVELLARYSEKLIALSEKKERIQRRIAFLIYVMISFLPLFIMMMLKLSIWEGSIGGVLIYPPLIYLLFMNIRRIKLVNEDVKFLTIKLEKIIGAASQIIRRAEQESVKYFALEFQLEDAERVLSHVRRS
jgi:Ca2+/Na+ antiporter